MKMTIRHKGKPAILKLTNSAGVNLGINLEDMNFDEGTTIELLVGTRRRIIMSEMKELPGTLGVMVERLDDNGIVIGHEEGGII